MDGNLNVVIVDDNKELAEIIRQYLSKRGFDVKIAESAKEAMSIWRRARGLM